MYDKKKFTQQSILVLYDMEYTRSCCLLVYGQEKTAQNGQKTSRGVIHRE